MRVLQISNGNFFSTYGGGQVYVKNIVDEMIQQQLDIVIFSFVNEARKATITKKDYEGIGLYELFNTTKTEIKELIRAIAPDLIHAHAQKDLFAEISKELSIPYIVTAHHGGIVDPAGTLMTYKDEIRKEPISHESSLPDVLNNIRCGLLFFPILKQIPLKWRLAIGRFLQKLPFIYFVTSIGKANLIIERKMQKWKIIRENTNLIIAPSFAIADSLMQNGLLKEKTQVIPHGIPTETRIGNIVPVDITGRKVKFFYVGRVCYVKGIHVLLEAFIQLPPSSCELHLIGGGDKKYINELKKKYGSKTNIFFHGIINPNEVLVATRNFDVLIHPTICLEVFGLNIAEALSEGKPVIATRCGGAEMQITDKENGLLVPPNSVTDLHQVMDWVLNNPDKVRQMSINAPLRVISIKEHVRKLQEIYKIQLRR
jgi:Glycosyltransferase